MARWFGMVKACDDAGVKLFVVKQNRRNFTLQLLNAIEKGRLAEFIWLMSTCFEGRKNTMIVPNGGAHGSLTVVR